MPETRQNLNGGVGERDGTGDRITTVPGIRGCKYIAGDPQSDDWSYCGEPVVRAGTAWCETHYKVIYGSAGAKRLAAELARKDVARQPAVAAIKKPSATVAESGKKPQEPAFRSLEDPMLLG